LPAIGRVAVVIRSVQPKVIPAAASKIKPEPASCSALSGCPRASQSTLRDTQARLGDENKQVMMRYMVYGGSIAGAGLLMGLILPALTRGRKKNDRWF